MANRLKEFLAACPSPARSFVPLSQYLDGTLVDGFFCTPFLINTHGDQLLASTSHIAPCAKCWSEVYF